MVKTAKASWVKKPYGGWPNCYWMTDGRVEMIVTTDVGPRIIRFGFVDEPNVFCEYPDTLGRSGDKQWLNYGGHRLWQAPEDPVRTYVPDNQAVPARIEGDELQVTNLVEQLQVEKSIRLRMGHEGQVQVIHRLRNRSAQPMDLAPWAISVMAPGGTAILALPPRGTHPACLSPTSTLSLWPYTDLTDPRWGWGRKYILLRQVPSALSPQKLGASVPDGWVAYANDGRLLVKTFNVQTGSSYPDLGSIVEVFTNSTMLEVETLGPLESVAPGEAVEHVEEWFLFRDVSSPGDDRDVDESILPHVQMARRANAGG
jgi:hypothetical protein